MKHIKRFNESHIIGNDPLEKILKVKRKLDELSSNIDRLSSIIIKDMDDESIEYYDENLIGLTDNIYMSMERLKILNTSIDDYIHLRSFNK